MDTVYLPREDSYLLQKHIEKSCKKNSSVLDMGTGSGIQAIAASKSAKKVVACDINHEAIKYAKEEAMNQNIKNIKFIESDLFSNIPNQKFDLIAFNPPYLPEEKNVENIALFSGKRGTKTTTRFIDDAAEFLADDGIILITGSSLAKKSIIDEAINKNLLNYELLETQHVFFEDIFVIKIVKSDLLKTLVKNKISYAEIFSHGKRGLIIKGIYKKKTVAVKVKNQKSDAMGTIANEARFLELLNKKGIGPKLILHKNDFLMYKFVTGDLIFDFVKKSKKNNILTVLKRVFEQMYLMDTLGINKFEMHHPIKHILIDKNKPVLIDFERARHTEDPKNVTQFCDFLIGEDMSNLLKEKKINLKKEVMINHAKTYKHNPIFRNYKKIIGVLK